ncbi:enoyl-CoA hydratase/isomerase family protein [Papillibacter cinnamivorans]|uniref:Enoyl-CoA hydratase n=1 Tax=Papillibacter cinnamivorans DSM 12816 TaxID=1122930 RepID=A0A1W2BL97_9FIRM|nr:enoyl-CoA hydratase-related protein [Papillibacter cinnamivorans]SMC73620.1 enoyl-CoA hydratase [Papillibacter cinnamivorans DSM 12816]
MEFVSTQIMGHVCVVTVDRPPVNALNLQLHTEIGKAFMEISDRNDIYAAVLRANGKMFMPGNDISTFENPPRSALLREADALKNGVGAVYNCRVPVICAVNGYALGAGLAYAAVCDILIAAQSAKFGLPEVKVGLVGAAGFLSLLIPPKVVRYMALTGSFLTAEEMMRYGAVHKVVPPDHLMAAVMETADELLSCPPLTLRAWKRAMNLVDNACLGDKFNLEHDFTMEMLETEDFKEAISAFREKRKPEYMGK